MHTHVVGQPIAHSMSPLIFSAAGLGIHCERAEVGAGELARFIAGPGSGDRGLSVTMPLKKEAFTVCTWVHNRAAQVGAINTLVIGELPANTVVAEEFSAAPHIRETATEHSAASWQGAQYSPGSSLTAGVARLPSQPQRVPIYGINTDISGIVAAVRETLGSAAQVSAAVILGSGATASSALAALQELHVHQIRVCARRYHTVGSVFEVAHRLGISVEYVPLAQAAQQLRDSDLLISTLPAHVADPIAMQLAAMRLPQLAVLDAAYNPYPSALTQMVVAAGGIEIPGYEMLIHQGIEQARIFSGREPDTAAIHQAVRTEVQLRLAGRSGPTA
ncbi:MAG: hypothetical protein MR006_01370 [Arcanobacterium sp.]|nr:hypothetical protein [Arcanobacterium sp.]